MQAFTCILLAACVVAASAMRPMGGSGGNGDHQQQMQAMISKLPADQQQKAQALFTSIMSLPKTANGHPDLTKMTDEQKRQFNELSAAMEQATGRKMPSLDMLMQMQQNRQQGGSGFSGYGFGGRGGNGSGRIGGDGKGFGFGFSGRRGQQNQQ